jgi:hypothetical protein
MRAAQPAIPAFNPSESTEDVRAQVRATLARIREKAKTGKMGADSTLFRLKKRLNENGTDEPEEKEDEPVAERM